MFMDSLSSTGIRGDIDDGSGGWLRAKPSGQKIKGTIKYFVFEKLPLSKTKIASSIRK
jgi:hypothetical protein